jgi:iron(III) transport system substrate-binding protein
LFAALLEHHGQDSFVAWLKSLKSNLARKPQGNDRARIKGVANGGCGIGIGNLYYYYKMLNSNDPGEQEAAAKVRWVPASVAGGGAHANISGIALAKHAPNRAVAMELIEFMVGPVAQRIYAAANSELPVRPGTTMPPELQEAASVPIDSIALHRIAARRAQVSKLVDQVGFDN